MARKTVKSNTIIKGVDMGNSFLKVHNQPAIMSTVVPVSAIDNYSKSGIGVVYDGKKYQVGGNSEVRINGIEKYMKPEYKIALLTMIAAGSEESDLNVNLVLGVPAQKQADYEDKYIENALEIENEKIIVDGEEYTITVESCMVVPQSYIVSTKKDVEYPCIVLDIGGGTSDFSIWEDGEKPIGKGTIDIGFDDYVEKFRQLIAPKVGKVSFYIALKFMDNPEGVQFKGESLDLTEEFESIANEFTSALYSLILKHPDYSENYKKMYLLGGCSETIKPNIKKSFEIKNEETIVVSKNAQLDNASAYHHLGELVYENNNK